MSSWRQNTKKQCSGYLNKWTYICREGNTDHFCAPVNICLDFFVYLHEKGVIVLLTLHVQPYLPCYTCTYDIKEVLDYLEYIILEEVTLTILSRKWALLLLLLTKQCVQILQTLDICGIHFLDTKCSLYKVKLIKTSGPGKHKSMIGFRQYNNVNLCVCPFKEIFSIMQSSALCGSHNQLF